MWKQPPQKAVNKKRYNINTRIILKGPGKRDQFIIWLLNRIMIGLTGEYENCLIFTVPYTLPEY